MRTAPAEELEAALELLLVGRSPRLYAFTLDVRGAAMLRVAQLLRGRYPPPARREFVLELLDRLRSYREAV